MDHIKIKTYRILIRIKFLIIFSSLAFLIYLVRVPILESMGIFLKYENLDSSNEIETLVVLSGNAYDRGTEAVKYLRFKKVNLIICPGSNPQKCLLTYNIKKTEAEVTRDFLIKNKIDSNKIVLTYFGTSTLEESVGILKYCTKNGIKKLSILSSDYHTRRVKVLFDRTFRDSKIKLYYKAAPSSDFNLKEWWKTESGLIQVNNEYIKLIRSYLN